MTVTTTNFPGRRRLLKTVFITFFLIRVSPVFSQQVPPLFALPAAEVPADFQKLLIANQAIFDNDSLNEEIVDMVWAAERDTVVSPRWTTHQSYFANILVKALGYYWIALDGRRYKFVGTAKSLLRLHPSEDDFLTEHDIIFDLLPHLKKYRDLMFRGITAQLSRKQAKNFDRTKPPYIYPTDSTLQAYRMHNELTPPKKLRDSLNKLFYPCLPGPNLDKHPSFCDPRPTVGMYGVYVLDCNHDCHPEIHPYEWIWWMDLSEKTPEGQDPKTWYFGLIRESSNRFWSWSRQPRTGTLSIPFIVNTSDKNFLLSFSHLVQGTFMEKGIDKMHGLPLKMRRFDFHEIVIPVVLNSGEEFPLRITSNRIIRDNALQWWLSDLYCDRNSDWLWGRFNLVVSVKDAYTARLECIYKPQAADEP